MAVTVMVLVSGYAGAMVASLCRGGFTPWRRGGVREQLIVPPPFVCIRLSQSALLRAWG